MVDTYRKMTVKIGKRKHVKAIFIVKRVGKGLIGK
ncbi:Protein of unknown function [Bacillus cytotoxicus]|uniref:Uncharacterized protein n=1 Tax=Bacillus cytotoxicus TaxID=580165 RepID=A0AAX2CIQ6_9BACI|nr:Protein of unknown function [Bacillus cytotoxicus]